MGQGELSIDHFRNTIKSETEKLTGFCTTWRQNLKNEENLSEENLGDINVAVGQAELLMKQRFGQFSNLIDQSENNTGEKEITCQDLDGFWFMIYPQVKDVYRKFDRIETLKNNKWVEPEVTAPPKKKSVIKAQKPFASTTKPKPSVSGKSGSASSSIRAHIMAAKMKMKEQQEKAQEKAQQDKPQIPQDNVKKVLAENIDKKNKSPALEIPSVQENSKNTILTTPRSESNKKTPIIKVSPTNGSKIPIRKVSPANKENCASLANTKVTGKKVTITTPKSSLKSQTSPPASRKCPTPESSTFDAGFFRVQTPVKKVIGKRIAAPPVTKIEKKETSTKSKVSTGPKMQKVLSSSMLKERVRNVPLEHKDYSSCMRITRSMKITSGVRKLDI